MDKASVARIESALGVELPRTYRQILLNYPQPLMRYESILEGPLLASANRLIDLNEELFDLDFWPDHLFAIGSVDPDGIFVVDLADEDPLVELWTHDLGAIDRTMNFASVEEFAGWLLAVSSASDV